MAIAHETRRKRVFIASSRDASAEVRKAIRHFDLDAVTLDRSAAPGTTWVESLHRCVDEADLVIGIMADRRQETNVLFELGVASAMNKPTLLFVSPDYPLDQLPPSGLPYLRTNLLDEEAVIFGVKQALSLSTRERGRPPAAQFSTHPLGPVADQLLARLEAASGIDLEDLIHDALEASGVPTIARGSGDDDLGVDLAAWSRDFEPTIANPLLIECKSRLHSRADVDRAVGQMLRGLQSIPSGFGIVLYKEGAEPPFPAPRNLPVAFVSAEDFLNSLRDTGLAQYVRRLRNDDAPGA